MRLIGTHRVSRRAVRGHLTCADLIDASTESAPELAARRPQTTVALAVVVKPRTLQRRGARSVRITGQQTRPRAIGGPALEARGAVAACTALTGSTNMTGNIAMRVVRIRPIRPAVRTAVGVGVTPVVARPLQPDPTPLADALGPLPTDAAAAARRGSSSARPSEAATRAGAAGGRLLGPATTTAPITRCTGSSRALVRIAVAIVNREQHHQGDDRGKIVQTHICRTLSWPDRLAETSRHRALRRPRSAHRSLLRLPERTPKKSTLPGTRRASAARRFAA
jgi:hypothetical protein